MSQKIVYPKPLPTLENQNYPLESGFALNEIVALQNGWRLIKRNLNYHAGKISTDEHYFLLDKFRDVETGKFNLSSLNNHTYQITNFYGRLIESGLNDVVYINMLLTEVGNKHKSYGITYDHIKLITHYMQQYFIEFLDKLMSVTFINGLQKLSELISEQHKSEKEGNSISKAELNEL